MAKNVLLAMSGGTDSSVSAILLQKTGYHIQGITFKMWETELSSCNEKDKGCCNSETLLEARELAHKLNFSHKIIDIREEFEKYVIENFVNEYMNGRTPNPCVNCNTYIKWGILLDEMKAQHCDFYATGHYARIRHENNRFVLMKGADNKKDQSYFLWTLTQEQLKYTIFPLGELTKPDVRKIAAENGFEKVANKPESQEICFVKDNDYRNFLTSYLPEIDQQIKPGNFLDIAGNILGQHKGYPFYTIGQRKGLNIALGKPAYVLSINKERNEIILGDYENLKRHQVRIHQTNWIKYAKPPENLEVEVKIRYKSASVPARIKADDKGYYLELYEAVFAVTPGQSAVIYEKEDVIGGGIILE
jgi:tRNA-uridine 2-sulfurtransferase